MADNVTLPGAGSIVGTDDVGGVQYQQIKLVDATLNSSTPIGTDTNPLRTGGPDCITLLSSTLTTAGVTATLDTAGFGAVVTQISGVWSGSLTFEQSNGNDAWDTVLVYSRDSVAIQDIITSNGLYTLRPSGRYLRLNVARITGSMVVNSIGRDDAGDSAVDALTLALDRQNNTPLNVSLQGVPQYADGSVGVAPAFRTINGTFLTAAGVVAVAPCQDMQYVTGVFNTAVGATGGNIYTVEALFPSRAGFIGIPCSWAQIGGNSNGYAVSNQYTQNGIDAFIYFIADLCGATAVRMRISSFSAGPVTGTMQLSTSPPAALGTITQISGSITTAGGTGVFTNPVIVGGVSTATGGGTASYMKVDTLGNVAVAASGSSASNGQTLDTNIITATAAAVRQIKASAGRVTMLQLSNGAANVAYLHLQNSNAAATTTAAAMTFAVPATAGANISIALPDGGLFMSSGIAYTVSGAIASGDVTALTAPSLAVNISYI